MNRIKNHSKELIILTILLAVAVSVVNAAVFVYYPITVTAQWGPRPVYFDEGSNAGQPDLGPGNTISVNLSEEDTVATITVNPSRRGTTRYRDVLQIVNDDNKAYNVWIRVNTPFGASIGTAQLIIGNTVVNLKTTGTTGPISLSAGGSLSVDLRFVISQSGSGSSQAQLELIYSPSSESPP